MPYPEFEPGTLDAAAGSPNHYTAWSAPMVVSYKCSALVPVMQYPIQPHSSLHIIKKKLPNFSGFHEALQHIEKMQGYPKTI